MNIFLDTDSHSLVQSPGIAVGTFLNSFTKGSTLFIPGSGNHNICFSVLIALSATDVIGLLGNTLSGTAPNTWNAVTAPGGSSPGYAPMLSVLKVG